MRSPSKRVSTPVRIGRASSLAAAKATSARARRRTFWLTRVVGRSPAAGIAGNSSASIPRRWVSKRPHRRWSRSPSRTSRSMRSFGSELTTSVRRRAGTVIAPSVSILPGTQYVIPISRFVAVSFRPASSVRRSTLASTGRVLRLDTAWLTTERPRARFSWMTDRFTDVSLRVRGQEGPVGGRGRAPPVGSSWMSSSHEPHRHIHHGVDGVDGRAAACGAGRWTRAARDVDDAAPRPGRLRMDGGRTIRRDAAADRRAAARV